ncbi:hypothetical protein F5Y17DRAFT_478479 [Xylariaceae sp. FL0594]|nr:hypothetical protein F5Y17DRAFT_478479 [Xylariaceae sp. FL0594]
MLSLSSLLNPAPPGPPPSATHRFPPSSPALPSPVDSSTEDYSSTFVHRPVMAKQHKMPKDAAVFTKSKPKGAINFRPYENLDEPSLRLVRKFQVYPLGKMEEYSRHIPYNSGKKDFYEKTGRESFEVFQYVFKVPGNDTEYAVMWDYNVGLTTPAKMLNSNPGLKEITHSITGGSIMAQGYWMPYQCAKAVCATFCYNISGALIPIFGPDFPALCTPPESPEYGRMIIDPAIVMRSTRDAEYYRRLSSNPAAKQDAETKKGGRLSGGDNNNGNHKHDRRLFRGPYDDDSESSIRRYRTRKTCSNSITTPASDISPYGTDTEVDIRSPMNDHIACHEHRYPPMQQRFHHLHSPLPSVIPSIRPSRAAASTGNTNGNTNSHHSSGWTPANLPPQPPSAVPSRLEHQPSGPSLWLSAIPRFTTTAQLQPCSSYPSMSTSTRHTVTRPQSTYATNKLQPHRGSSSNTASDNSYSFATSYRQQCQLPSPSDAPPPPPQLPAHHFLQQQRQQQQSREIQIQQQQLRDQQGQPHTRVKRRQTDDDDDISPVERQRIKTSPTTSDNNYYYVHVADRALREAEDERMMMRDGRSCDGGNGSGGGGGGGGADKKAALLLMNLSVRDHHHHHNEQESGWKSAGKLGASLASSTRDGDDKMLRRNENCRRRSRSPAINATITTKEEEGAEEEEGETICFGNSDADADADAGGAGKGKGKLNNDKTFTLTGSIDNAVEDNENESSRIALPPPPRDDDESVEEEMNDSEKRRLVLVNGHGTRKRVRSSSM